LRASRAAPKAFGVGREFDSPLWHFCIVGRFCETPSKRRLTQTPSNVICSEVTALYLEDLHVGDRFGSETIEVTKESIFDFARQFDPQPFHLETEAAEQSIFKELTASGWHTAAMSMRLFVTGQFKPVGGSIGLAVDELRWPKPVRPGDILRVETEILNVRPSRSKPDRGIIRIRNMTTNQLGEVVQTFLAFVMVRRAPIHEER
jgi:acyl dehydratase